MNQSNTINDDGLTDEERGVLQTPVSQIAPEQRHLVLALRDKKASFIYAENDRIRQHEAEKRKQLAAGE